MRPSVNSIIIQSGYESLGVVMVRSHRPPHGLAAFFDWANASERMAVAAIVTRHNCFIFGTILSEWRSARPICIIESYAAAGSDPGAPGGGGRMCPKPGQSRAPPGLSEGFRSG